MKAIVIPTLFARTAILLSVSLFIACCDDPGVGPVDKEEELIVPTNPTDIQGDAITQHFGGKINPQNLHNYSFQDVPDYIRWDNGRSNPITDEGATLGRVLFYDRNLSIDNSISCSSCHMQEFGFSDTALVSRGVEGGVTVRHSMRLVNNRFNAESKYFWDERAETLEDQVLMPIQDFAEMGFSGEQGRPDFDDLIHKLESIDYYAELFTMTYGSADITKGRIRTALAQFVRSIQSFDSKYDQGYATNFSNFTEQEKFGMKLFDNDPIFSFGSRQGGGLGCFNCHRPPEFDIKPNGGNNGEIGVFGDLSKIDVDNTKAPTLRDLINHKGELNGPMMHDASARTLEEMVRITNNLDRDPRNTNLDPLYQGEFDVRGNVSNHERDALIAFLHTLSGQNVYTDERWSDPFN